MKKRTRSILEELNNLGQNKNTDELIETRGNNLIESAINLINLVRNQYSDEIALDLEKRFLNSIRSQDPKKFKRGMGKVFESRDRKEPRDDS